MEARVSWPKVQVMKSSETDSRFERHSHSSREARLGQETMALTSSTDLGTLLTLDGIAATGGPEAEMGFQRAQQNHWEVGT
jgi:hypothetical protein